MGTRPTHTSAHTAVQPHPRARPPGSTSRANDVETAVTVASGLRHGQLVSIWQLHKCRTIDRVMLQLTVGIKYALYPFFTVLTQWGGLSLLPAADFAERPLGLLFVTAGFDSPSP